MPKLHGLFEASAARWPERVMVEFLGRQFTYAQMQGLVENVATALKRHGLKPGERVGLCLPNCPYFVAFFYGVLKAGGVVVTLNPLYTAAELTGLIIDSGARLVVGIDAPLIVSKLTEVKRSMAKLTVVACPLGGVMPTFTGFAYGLFQAAGVNEEIFLPYQRLMGEAGKLSAPGGKKIDPRVALLQYTGGTTGTPKAAMLTHANLLANTRQCMDRLGSEGEERILTVLPLFHVFALTSGLLMGTALGATLTLVPRFTAQTLLKTIRAARPTLLPGVPALFDALTLQKGLRREIFAGIRYGISGGAPLPPGVKARFEASTGLIIREGYGLTEASPVLACTSTIQQKLGSVGLPLMETKLAAHDAKTGKKLKPNEKGEIWAKGPQVMLGYWNKPKETRQVLKNGWLRTGDVGHIDSDGWLFITDRLKDLIIVNGYKVYPRMVEEALQQHPAVAEVTVAAIPHPHKGEVPKAFIRVKPGAKVSVDDIRAFAAAHLNPMERPAEVEFREVLPKSLIGKPLRRALTTK